jgi:quercetin dioxygenase-like cupin family protein
MQGWQDHDATSRVRFTFPVNRLSGAETSAIVHYELEPGERLGRHTDSVEEVLYFVAGTAQAEVDGEYGRVSAGDIAVIPALAPHGVVNVGEETLKIVGFFGAPEVTSVFERELQPFGETTFEQAAA